MSNILVIPQRTRCTIEHARADLLTAVAQRRHGPENVFWLKECAELLSVYAATGVALPEDALAPFEAFYAELPDRISFYPQYYRFLLSLCLDLEDLGMTGAQGEELCNLVAQEQLAEAELSDLQRAEARRLLGRRNQSGRADAALDDRLRRFVERSETFALPNKKACYELTHIVFYLSDYGKRHPQLSSAAHRSLDFAGLLAFLDQDHDLLAEICIALRFAGCPVPDAWQAAVSAVHKSVSFSASVGAADDGYHAYLVTGWAEVVAGRAAFSAPVPQGPLHIAVHSGQPGALRPMSARLYQIGRQRRAQWSAIREAIVPALSPEATEVLLEAEKHPAFEPLFELFARADPGPRRNTPRPAATTPELVCAQSGD